MDDDKDRCSGGLPKPTMKVQVPLHSINGKPCAPGSAYMLVSPKAWNRIKTAAKAVQRRT